MFNCLVENDEIVICSVVHNAQCRSAAVSAGVHWWLGVIRGVVRDGCGEGTFQHHGSLGVLQLLCIKHHYAAAVIILVEIRYNGFHLQGSFKNRQFFV